MYKNKYDIQLENKFSAIPINIPLVENMKDSYKHIQKATKVLKSSFPYMLLSYNISYWSNVFAPRIIP